MTADEAETVEKSIRTSPVKPGIGGGDDLDTEQFHFISVTPTITARFTVQGLREDIEDPAGGAVYNAAIKVFGCPEGEAEETWLIGCRAVLPASGMTGTRRRAGRIPVRCDRGLK